MTMENDLWSEPRFAVRLKGAARQLKALREFMGFAGASSATCKAAEATCLAAASRIQSLEAELAAAIIEVSNQAQLRGEAEGKLHVSELAGIVEGWQLRAERAEAELATTHLAYQAENKGSILRANAAVTRADRAEAELARKTEALQGLLRCEYESAGMGLYDCVDNHGKPYQSADLDAQIKRAEAALSPALEEKTDV